jgi:hypothetical protein
MHSRYVVGVVWDAHGNVLLVTEERRWMRLWGIRTAVVGSGGSLDGR